MSTLILLPKLGFLMNEGTVPEWQATDGAKIGAGQPLVTGT
jgi:pyruvate/2-oxoglutarate dehydrogenase complex dihydrolipoamide acyltransferase (E2) component